MIKHHSLADVVGSVDQGHATFLNVVRCQCRLWHCWPRCPTGSFFKIFLVLPIRLSLVSLVSFWSFSFCRLWVHKLCLDVYPLWLTSTFGYRTTPLYSVPLTYQAYSLSMGLGSLIRRWHPSLCLWLSQRSCFTGRLGVGPLDVFKPSPP